VKESTLQSFFQCFKLRTCTALHGFLGDIDKTFHRGALESLIHRFQQRDLNKGTGGHYFLNLIPSPHYEVNS